jgi:hypothetical protein
MNAKVHFKDEHGTQQVVEFSGADSSHIESFVMMLLVRSCIGIKVEVLGW